MQDISFWDSCLRSFKKSLPPQQYNSWIRPLILKSENGSLVLTAPNSFTLKLVQERFLPEISRLAGLAYPQVPPFEFRVLDAPLVSKPAEPVIATDAATKAENKSRVET
ncbi:MAG: DnaA N-terminal domain-containing protein, partial [Gallionella sp.]